PGIARNRHYLAIWVGELGCQCPGHRDAHGSEAVGDVAGVWALGAVHTSHPHLVRADVADHDVVSGERCAQVAHDFLRLYRETLIVVVTGPLLADPRAERFGRGAVLRTRREGDAAQRLADVPQ